MGHIPVTVCPIPIPVVDPIIPIRTVCYILPVVGRSPIPTTVDLHLLPVCYIAIVVVRLIPIQVVVDLIHIPVPVGHIPIPVAVAAAKKVLLRHIPAVGSTITVTSLIPVGPIPIPMCPTQSTAHTRTVLMEGLQATPTHSANTATSRQIRLYTEVIWNERKQKAADLPVSRVPALSLLSGSQVVIA